MRKLQVSLDKAVEWNELMLCVRDVQEIRVAVSCGSVGRCWCLLAVLGTSTAAGSGDGGATLVPQTFAQRVRTRQPLGVALSVQITRGHHVVLGRPRWCAAGGAERRTQPT